MKTKVGKIVSKSAGKVRISIPAEDNKVSALLSVLDRQDSYIPNINDQVLCVFTSASEGFVLGKV